MLVCFIVSIIICTRRMMKIMTKITDTKLFEKPVALGRFWFTQQLIHETRVVNITMQVLV